MSKPTTLKIAVLITPPIQLLDLSPIDLFHMLSKQYLRECQLPQPLITLGLDTVTIHYVGEAGPSSSSSSSSSNIVAETTASAAIRLTHNLTSPAVQPGQIELLFIPGPDPSLVPSEPVQAFIRAHSRSTTTKILSVCTGIFPLAYSGVLDGRECTGPRALLGMRLMKEFPRAKWVERRWAVDAGAGTGELWTAGGITNGFDMVVAYLRRNYGTELVDLVCGLADVQARDQEYATSKAGESVWWLWLIVRSWAFGSGAKGRRVKKDL